MSFSTGLEDLYREIILDHYRRPRNRGELPVPPAKKGTGFNPLCGDEVIVYLNTIDGKLEVRIQGRGCSISQSSASLMSEAIKGKTITEARALVDKFKAMMSVHHSELDVDDEDQDSDAQLSDYGSTEQDFKDLGEISALRGVVKFPVRIKCATLPWNTLLEVLGDLEEDPS